MPSRELPKRGAPTGARGLTLPLVGLALSSALLSPAREAHAQGRGQTTPLGGRSVLLGGTGVAAGSDASVPLLNPAGILSVDAGLLDFSTRFVRIGVREYERFRRVGTVDAGGNAIDDPDVVDINVSALPSGSCYFGRILAGPQGGDQRPHKFSFCIYQSEHDRTNAHGGIASVDGGAGRVDLATSVSTEWKRNHFGVGWATPLGDDAAIGLSTFAVQTSMSRTDVAASLGQSGPVGSTYLHTLSGSTFQLVTRLGFTLNAGRHLRLGGSVRAPGLSILRNGSVTSSLSSTDGVTLFEAGDGHFAAPLPAQVALGLAWRTHRLHLEVNSFHDFPGEMASFEPDELSVLNSADAPQPSRARLRQERARGRTNVAFGVEYDFDESYSGLAGAASNFSSLNPRDVTSDSQLFPSRRNGATLSLGMGARGPLGKLLAGVRVEYLFGELMVPDAMGKRLLVDDDEWAATLTFSGQIRVADALRRARDMLVGEPSPQRDPIITVGD